eukprot:CAMPEP_0203878314 /NCGR_PEP_ID=MMETSP0359-20131031/22854_1 /ASSEMBLY_ACC=CAM_ASM_000338 /TAXON_ID=268821 /ORGANISM="Scrippsiella Hangoei, Strain SHTV-5" /LENGTH=49 /DNA_ID= /DNA_START= /DNA_END= /DNA_ORIENTATION=
MKLSVWVLIATLGVAAAIELTPGAVHHPKPSLLRASNRRFSAEQPKGLQ